MFQHTRCPGNSPSGSCSAVPWDKAPYLQDRVKELIIGNTSQLKQISLARNNTDKIDADKLCQALKAQVLSGVQQIVPVSLPVNEQVKQIWYKWLNRRSTKVNQDWQQFSEYLRNFLLPRPRIMHS
jgi:hypothetical protein